VREGLTELAALERLLLLGQVLILPPMEEAEARQAQLLLWMLAEPEEEVPARGAALCLIQWPVD
jgi:hypothetical protein